MRTPLMAPIATLAERVRAERRPAREDNPFLAIQENASHHIVAALDAWKEFAETVCERTFLAVYGSPTLQAAVGIDPSSTRPVRMASRSPLQRELLEKRNAELKAAIPTGGLRAAIVRGMIYVGLGRAAVDERGFGAVKRAREAHPDLSLSEFKQLVREQFTMLNIDQDAALAAIPSMLPAAPETRAEAFELIRQVLLAIGPLSAEDNARLAQVGRLFGVGDGGVATPFRQNREERQARAS